MWKALNGLEQETLETQAGAAGLVLLLVEVYELGLLVDGVAKRRHGGGEAVNVGGVVVDDVFVVKLSGKIRENTVSYMSKFYFRGHQK